MQQLQNSMQAAIAKVSHSVAPRTRTDDVINILTPAVDGYMTAEQVAGKLGQPTGRISIILADAYRSGRVTRRQYFGKEKSRIKYEYAKKVAGTEEKHIAAVTTHRSYTVSLRGCSIVFTEDELIAFRNQLNAVLATGGRV